MPPQHFSTPRASGCETGDISQGSTALVKRSLWVSIAAMKPFAGCLGVLATVLLTNCGGEATPFPSGTGGEQIFEDNSTQTSGGAAGGTAGTLESGGSLGTGAAVTTGGSELATGASMNASLGDAGTMPMSSSALEDLASYLAMPRAQRPELATAAFASVPLTRLDAEQAVKLLWDDFASDVRDTRMGEMGATESNVASLQVGGSTLRYYQTFLGEEPPEGRSLFISMHGGGNTSADVNDQQWDNQLALAQSYAPQNALWVAPRAPSDEWNMWFTADVDALFERLITNMIVFEGINPNRVYLTGYSAGGDAVYQLGPRMADAWAGAGMSAGHPNDASPVNLRNVAFAIHVGGDDTAYDRNLRAAEWGQMLDALAASDGAGGYPVQWEVHAGLPHWMNLADAVSIPFLQQYTRDPSPNKVVWRQADVPHARFYWLAADVDNRAKGTQVTASYVENIVTLSEVSQLSRLTIRLSDEMLNMDQTVRVEFMGSELFAAQVPRTILVIDKTIVERGDPAMIYFGEVSVELP